MASDGRTSWRVSKGASEKCWGARRAKVGPDRGARVISAEGEAQAAEKLVKARQTTGINVDAMRLRYLNSLQDAAGSQASRSLYHSP